MTHLIVATHGKFSAEIVNSAAMVFGEDENTHVVTFLPGEGGDDLVAKYQAIIANLPENEPVLFLVDLFGGSPYNAAARVATERANTDIVTGISLPMLLECLDAKDSSSLAELVETAKEVGVQAVKSFRNPEAKAKPAKPINPTSIQAEKTPPHLNGNLNISLLRIDSRLIHGQVATSWAKAVKCEAIFAVNDDVANDKLRRELLLQIVPAGLKGYVIPVDKAIKVYHNPKYTGKNILWLVTNPADIIRLIEGGVKINKVNVGGMTYKDGNKQLSEAVTVSKADVEAFKKLIDLGVELTMQQVATSSKVEVTKAKLNALQF
ncbi:PTS system mannose-specific EIIAB component [Lonepinella sp. MS14434]|uniref:mannose/fructose/sorbose PTS transporter subunit IIB n=1 Tax=Lonepinella sp. MS14434 TaxID=3003617 RepID=UPI0036DF922F